ncbi:MAG: hypothetical protein QM689_00040 [Oscillospiraceae bacterium]
MSKYYKLSNRISAPGLILMIVSMCAVGAALSFIYLFVQEKNPLIYLGILLAFLFAGGLGWICSQFVKAFKITNAPVTYLAVIIGVVIFTYFNWAVYVARDYQATLDQTKADYGTDMKQSSAYEYWGYDWYFGENPEAVTKSQITAVLEKLKTESAYDDYQAYLKDTGYSVIGTNSELLNLYKTRHLTAYESNQMQYLYGSDINDAADYILKTAQNSDLSAYDFYFDDIAPRYALGKVLTDPQNLWATIVNINKEGRWSMHRSYSSSNTDNEAVHGIMLWIAWLGEALLFFIVPLMMVKHRLEIPFIEYERRYAALFANPLIRFNDIEPKRLKAQVEADPESLLLSAVQSVPPSNPFLSIELYHSADFTENYLSIYRNTYVKKNRKYQKHIAVRNLSVSKAFVAALLHTFPAAVPMTLLGMFPPSPPAQTPAQPATPQAATPQVAEMSAVTAQPPVIESPLAAAEPLPDFLKESDSSTPLE